MHPLLIASVVNSLADDRAAAARERRARKAAKAAAPPRARSSPARVSRPGRAAAPRNVRAVLPPGPSTPSAVQTWEWLARPTTLLRRCAARYGEPFTLRTAWTDAPMVVVSDPAAVRAVFTAPVDVAVGGASSTFLEPFVGPSSILVLDGAAHLRQRKLMLPPFHGDRMRAHRELIAGLAAAEVARWPAGEPIATHGRMQALTLDIIMRVVFGAELPALRTAIRRTLDMTMSLPRMLLFSLTGNDLGFRRALDSVEAGLTAAIRERRAGPPRAAILDDLIAAGSTDDELRDQLVTLLAAGPRDDRGIAGVGARAARAPPRACSSGCAPTSPATRTPSSRRC